MRKYTPWVKPGDERTVTAFLFFPRWIGEEVRWLEKATWKEVAVRSVGDVGIPCVEWEPKEWIDAWGAHEKFRKRPIVIEAFQYNPEETYEDVSRLINDENGYIDTLEGTMTVSPNDWIITGIEGEKYPCKPDIFRKTYEPVE